MSKMLMTVAALGLIASAPAFADPREPKPEASTASASAPIKAKKPTRYCVQVEAHTGSRIDRQVCQTRDNWLKEGFDPLAPQSR